MRKIIQIICGASLLVGALTITPAWAQFSFDSQSRFAGRFAERGRIVRVDLTHNEIVIGDSARKLAPDIRVYAPNGNNVSPESLKRGMNIGFNIAMDPQTHAPVVAEILISPSE